MAWCGLCHAQANTQTCNKYVVMSAKANLADDIKKGTVSLYIIGGIVSALQKGDEGFAEKYGVNYHDFGCVVPGNLEYYELYNGFAFEYLDAKFGKKWRKEVNMRTMGFVKWRERK